MKALLLLALVACARPPVDTPSNVSYVLAPYTCALAAPPIAPDLYKSDPTAQASYLEAL